MNKRSDQKIFDEDYQLRYEKDRADRLAAYEAEKQANREANRAARMRKSEASRSKSKKTRCPKQWKLSNPCRV